MYLVARIGRDMDTASTRLSSTRIRTVPAQIRTQTTSMN